MRTEVDLTKLTPLQRQVLTILARRLSKRGRALSRHVRAG